MRRTHFSLFIVSFAVAMAVFFGWPSEPPIWISLALVLVSCAVLYFARHRDMYRLTQFGMCLLMFSLGFAWAQAHTQWQAHMTGALYVPNGKQEVTLSGVIVWVEPTERSSIIDLQLRDAHEKSVLVRLYGKLAATTYVKPGCVGTFQARLKPLSLPTVSSGYDPRFSPWFSGRRAVGFVRDIQSVDCTAPLLWSHRLARWRLSLAAHFRDSMSEQAGPVAASLVTGVRGAISKPVRDAFRHSGLAHMLAISGLHMALFAGSVYAVLRFLAALWPALVLRYDVRKPAAMAALVAATGYLAVSGASIATQRAYVMLAILFLAILVDRPAVTMRNVLWAVLIVLLIQPQAIVQVGFQMSFAAVMALVAVYESWRRRDRLFIRLDEMSPWQRTFRLGARYSSALFFTSLIAGSVTGFIALTQFYQIGSYSLFANLFAMPIFSSLIMPMAPLSLLVLPFGGDRFVTPIMQLGIEYVVGGAQWITSFDGALLRVGASPDWLLPVAGSGFVFLCLVRTKWRWLGVMPIIVAALFIGRAERPLAYFVGRDIIIVQQADGGLQRLRQRRRNYELQRIARFHGRYTDEIGAAKECAAGCDLIAKDGIAVAYRTRAKDVAVACETADLVIAPFATSEYPCKALLIDETKLHYDVPMQIVIDGNRLRMKTAARTRLWQR